MGELPRQKHGERADARCSLREQILNRVQQWERGMAQHSHNNIHPSEIQHFPYSQAKSHYQSLIISQVTNHKTTESLGSLTRSSIVYHDVIV